MKKIAIFAAIVLAGCSAPKPVASTALYDVLTQQSQGGATIRFYEILTQENEIRMLMSDEALRGKIRPEDMAKSNFVILNMGEKPTAGHSITVAQARETADSVILTIKETAPEGMAAQVMTYPYTVVRVNSKKKIIIE